MLFLPGPAWLLLSKIARRLIYSLYTHYQGHCETQTLPVTYKKCTLMRWFWTKKF